ncbi:hypothetical protein [Acidovorax sp.]|uniref:hypothetical protein n=1 Tax=Acidovorax sp. TaxID=1872122 RepID=UPI00391F00C7
MTKLNDARERTRSKIRLTAQGAHPGARMSQRLVLCFEARRLIDVHDLPVHEFNRYNRPFFLVAQGDPTAVVFTATKPMLCRDETHSGSPPNEIATLMESASGSRA